MSFSETIFLFFLALVIFGPKKLPEIARQVGKYLNEFKRASNEFRAQIEHEISNLEVEKHEVEKQQTILPPSPPPEGATSRTRALDAAPIEAGPGDALAKAIPGTEAPAAAAPPDDEPLFATSTATGALAVPSSPVASPAISSSDDLTSPTTRDSHV